MIRPAARIHVLAIRAERLSGEALALMRAGHHDAALAAEDQAAACEYSAWKVAEESGDWRLMSLWDEQ